MVGPVRIAVRCVLLAGMMYVVPPRVAADVDATGKWILNTSLVATLCLDVVQTGTMNLRLPCRRTPSHSRRRRTPGYEAGQPPTYDWTHNQL